MIPEPGSTACLPACRVHDKVGMQIAVLDGANTGDVWDTGKLRSAGKQAADTHAAAN
jgi:hypothetical protein